MDKIRVGILGYGNLGKGVELALAHNSDMELAGIFTRRQGVATRNGQALSIDAIGDYRDKIDVLILCGGSATDLPEQGKRMLAGFNTVDSFDTHARIPEHFAAMDKIGKRSGHLGIISVGWDPGLFSIARLLFGSVLPNGKDYTFWGRGVSQGHSDAIRRIDGVLDARQYTVPVPQALDRVRRLRYDGALYRRGADAPRSCADSARRICHSQRRYVFRQKAFVGTARAVGQQSGVYFERVGCLRQSDLSDA